MPKRATHKRGRNRRTRLARRTGRRTGRRIHHGGIPTRELQRIRNRERDITREDFCNRHFETYETLKAQVLSSLRTLEEMRDEFRRANCGRYGIHPEGEPVIL